MKDAMVEKAPVVLSRQSLLDGSFLESIPTIDGLSPWTLDQVSESVAKILAARRGTAPVWVFAYGSLIWNPLIDFEESIQATLHGWRRSFCIRLMIGRATVSQPGRMMGLVEGGTTTGFAFRIKESKLTEELQILWAREMVLGGYRPEWVWLEGPSGPVQALTFVADTHSMLFEASDDPDRIAQLVGAATGPLGRNRDYVVQLSDALKANSMNDLYVQRLSALLSLQA